MTPAWATQAIREDRRCGVPDHDDHEPRLVLRSLGTLYVLAGSLFPAWIAARIAAPPPVALVLLAIICVPVIAFEVILWLLAAGERRPHRGVRMTREVIHFILVSGAALVPVSLHAQCAPAVQRLITDRKYDAARDELLARLKRAPNDNGAMHCMGRLLLEQGESGDAVDWFEKAVKINGLSAQHHLWLGQALGTEGQKASILRRPFLVRRMKAAYEQAVALDPTLVDARRGLVMIYSLAPGAMGGSMSKAREQAAEILKLNPMRGHIAYGTIAERDKDYAGAEKEFVAGVAAMPDSAIPYNATGSFYRRRERWADAIAMYEKALAAKADVVSTSIAHYHLGEIHQQNGRKDQAKAEYQAALTANPKNEDAKKALASLKNN